MLKLSHLQVVADLFADTDKEVVEQALYLSEHDISTLCQEDFDKHVKTGILQETIDFLGEIDDVTNLEIGVISETTWEIENYMYDHCMT